MPTIRGGPQANPGGLEIQAQKFILSPLCMVRVWVEGKTVYLLTNTGRI